MEILMPTTGTDAKGDPVRKKKYLYFQMNWWKNLIQKLE
jgi:hypothetical protein